MRACDHQTYQENKQWEQLQDKEWDKNKTNFLRSVSPLYYSWPLFLPQYENLVLNYGKHFTAKAAGNDTEVNSSIYQRVHMVLITITTSASRKALTTLRLLHSAHWSPVFFCWAQARKKEAEMGVGRLLMVFGTPTITMQELAPLGRDCKCNGEEERHAEAVWIPFKRWYFFKW